jgi:uncharacterized protein (DUF697 family)
MATQKFTYTVSGVDLTEAQKAKISQEIAATVTRVVLGESAKQIQPQLLSLHGVYGGKLADFSVERPTEDFLSSGCQ